MQVMQIYHLVLCMFNVVFHRFMLLCHILVIIVPKLLLVYITLLTDVEYLV